MIGGKPLDSVPLNTSCLQTLCVAAHEGCGSASHLRQGAVCWRSGARRVLTNACCSLGITKPMSMNAKASCISASGYDVALLSGLSLRNQRFSLALLSNIHSIIPLLSFLRETIPKLTRKISDTAMRTAALSSLISRFPSDSVSSTEQFIHSFRILLLWEQGRELGASFRLEMFD